MTKKYMIVDDQGKPLFSNVTASRAATILLWHHRGDFEIRRMDQRYNKGGVPEWGLYVSSPDANIMTLEPDIKQVHATSETEAWALLANLVVDDLNTRDLNACSLKDYISSIETDDEQNC